MTQQEFSTRDAQNLIFLAQNAPLRNLKEAEQVSALLLRFQAWFEHVTKPAGAAPETPAKPTRKPRTPATPAEDILG